VTPSSTPSVLRGVPEPPPEILPIPLFIEAKRVLELATRPSRVDLFYFI
jgi:hypothetical protein